MKRARTNSLAGAARESSKAAKFMHKAQASNAKATLKEMVEYFTANPSEVGPCWAAIKNGMFKQADDKAADADMLSERQHHVRTLSATTLKWLIFEIYGDASIEKLGVAQKKNKQANMQAFCLLFAETPGHTTPTLVKNELAKFYTERQHLFQGRKLHFGADGQLDLVGHGSYCLVADAANTGRFIQVKHLSGATATRPELLSFVSCRLDLCVRAWCSLAFRCDFAGVGAVRIRAFRIPRLCVWAEAKLPEENFVDLTWKINENYADTWATLVSASGHTKIPLMAMFPELKTVHEAVEAKRAALERKPGAEGAVTSDGGAAASVQAVVPRDRPRVRV